MEFSKDLEEILKIADIKKLQKMLAETKRIVPDGAAHNLFLINKISILQDRIRDLEIEDITCCLGLPYRPKE